MPSDLEQLFLVTVDFNDQVVFSLEDMVFKPAEAKPKWAGNADADGELLVEEPQYTNSYFELLVRVVPAEDTDAALEALGSLMDAVQGCTHAEGGSPLEWTPNNSSTTYTAYAVLGEIVDLPITVDGELAGWFVESPVVRVKLTCRPFLYTPPRVVLEPVDSEDPVQVVYVEGVKGDVPAEGELVVTDKASQVRRYAEWGQDVVESAEGNPDLLLEADDLVIGGFAGELASKEGSVSGEVVKAALTSTPATLYSTGSIANLGSFRVKIRCQASETGALFRALYRVGDGPWAMLPWTECPDQDQWFEIDLREASLEETEEGQQVAEVRIQGKASGSNCTAYVDVQGFVPTRRYGVVRAVLLPDLVCAADQSMKVLATTAIREDATGSHWSPVPRYRGTGFYLDPAGYGGRINRLAVKMRRDDLPTEPDSAIGDKQQLEVLVRERFRLPRGEA